MCDPGIQRQRRLPAAKVIIVTEFERDPDFKRSYVDNIACVLMDTGMEAFQDKLVRDKLAEKILDRITE